MFYTKESNVLQGNNAEAENRKGSRTIPIRDIKHTRTLQISSFLHTFVL